MPAVTARHRKTMARRGGIQRNFSRRVVGSGPPPARSQHTVSTALASPGEVWASGPVVRALYARHLGQYEVSTWAEGDPMRLSATEQETIDKVLEYSSTTSLGSRRSEDAGARTVCAKVSVHRVVFWADRETIQRGPVFHFFPADESLLPSCLLASLDHGTADLWSACPRSVCLGAETGEARQSLRAVYRSLAGLQRWPNSQQVARNASRKNRGSLQ